MCLSDVTPLPRREIAIRERPTRKTSVEHWIVTPMAENPHEVNKHLNVLATITIKFQKLCIVPKRRFITLHSDGPKRVTHKDLHAVTRGPTATRQAVRTPQLMRTGQAPKPKLHNTNTYTPDHTHNVKRVHAQSKCNLITCSLSRRRCSQMQHWQCMYCCRPQKTRSECSRSLMCSARKSRPSPPSSLAQPRDQAWTSIRRHPPRTARHREPLLRRSPTSWQPSLPRSAGQHRR